MFFQLACGPRKRSKKVMPHTLSPELIEEIALYLRARDISSLALSSRQFHDIVNGSLLLQYAYRTELAGVYDPLRDLSQCSIIDRMESLRRWEASWNDLGRYLSVSRGSLVIPAERDLFDPFFLRDDYLFAVDWQGHPTGLRHPALLYVDLRDALRTGKHSWRKIHYPKSSIAITQAFSIEEDDLVVSILNLLPVDSTAMKTLDTELSVDLLDVGVDVIGGQIVLALVDLHIHIPESDTIYLVDWKRGRMTLQSFMADDGPLRMVSTFKSQKLDGLEEQTIFGRRSDSSAQRAIILQQGERQMMDVDPSHSSPLPSSLLPSATSSLHT
ncbi:hypothetical protein F5888DRAFT_1879353 [Russula emetica]|nr:hypothetical protein F5888DRAFT_1879353 [Russula emetica]